MKKAIFVMLLLIAHAAMASGHINLYKATSRLGGKYGILWQDVQISMLVKRIRNIEKVYIEDAGGTYDAKFVKNVDNNYSLWEVKKAYGNRHSSEPVTDFDFSLTLETHSGIKYIDDNDGKNFVLKANDGTILGTEVAVSLFKPTRQIQDLISQNRFLGAINVKNIAYDKDIKIIYTFNNWRTTQETSARYLSGHLYGYSYVYSPNIHGTEIWSFSIDLPRELVGSDFDFAISYTVDGKTYWDNNFGNNYKYHIK